MKFNDKQRDSELAENIRTRKPVFWTNPARSEDGRMGSTWDDRPIGCEDVRAAEDRFRRFSRVLTDMFPELRDTRGAIESAVLPVPALQSHLGIPLESGRVLIKADHALPVAGSIKARGGIHEVLEFAEKQLLKSSAGTLAGIGDLSLETIRETLGKYQVAVGSTGNLGLSIGVIASALGLGATVHMSADAKRWKKDRLRKRGVQVVEHEGDYGAAVEAGRTAAAADPNCHFVDDEGSLSLFMGYSTAASELRTQLSELGIQIDADHPLFVYLPCGVGGAPGGIAFGLSHVFGPHVHCFFAEPTASPCFLLSLLDESGSNPSVYDIGLDNATEADGLAVPRASARAVEVMRSGIGGVFTVEDEALFKNLHAAAITQGIRVEPSATAAFEGPLWLTSSGPGNAYLARTGLTGSLPKATHLIWTTGGLFVPENEYQAFFERGA
ncbi:D-serine ammonia-lyase [Variovorax atrisoli]|uniref:D-serine ammonia-lyase n=1 Tax=Variovorax atrisoli TaxID=3394203 RepID=UPI000475B300|nr:D-serine ammonia-lyase [Variovorax paradoxus]